MVAVRPALASAAAAAILLGGACQSLIGVEDSPPLSPEAGVGGDAQVEAAGGSGGQAGGAGGDSGCNLAKPPKATAGADPGGDIELVVAIRKVDLGDGSGGGDPSWPKLGYDLDNLCSCGTDSAGSCKAPTSTACDGIDGRDNALGAFLYQLRSVFNLTKLTSEALSATVEAGAHTILIRVRGYNGTPNDSVVEVAWFSSDDFQVTHAAPPKWDGTDDWPIVASSLEPKSGLDGSLAYSLEDPKFVDKLAFVSNGTLVSNLPQGSFGLTSIPAMKISAAVFTAKVTSVANGQWALHQGVLAGITEVNNVLKVLPWVDDPFTKLPICMDNLAYVGIKNVICDAPDMTILGSPTKPCDHLSLGVGLTGDPAKLGTIIDKPAEPDKCPPGKNPAADSC